jgi:hypothetical protein
MLTNKECRQYLNKYELSEQQIEEIKENMYAIIEVILEEYLANVRSKSKTINSQQEKLN